MSVTTTPLHDVAHAKDVIARNKGISFDVLLKHPLKNCTPEARTFLENDGKDASKPDAFQALTQPPAKTVPVESIVPPPDREATPVNPILQAALRCVEKGWYVFALEERGKRPDSELSPHGFNSSTNDPEVVRAIFTKKPNANYGIDLGRSNLTVLDFDAGMPNGLQLPNTLQVSTSRGVHVYFQGVSKQGNMHVNGAHVGEIKSAGGYVLGPQCVHPSGAIYTPIVIAPVATTPSLEQFRVKGEKETSRNERGLVPHGSIHGFMLKEAGRMRHIGLNQEEIEAALLRKVHEECEAPIDDAKVRAMAKSICIYQEGEDKSLLFTQKADEQAAPVADDAPDVAVENGITYAIIPHGQGFRRVAIDTSEAAARPVFPQWVMNDTSIYVNLVKPAVETSSKYAELIFIPAMQMMMNYLSRRVQIELHPTDMNLFVGLVTPFGEYFKSSSCKLGQDYMMAAGICGKYSKEMKNADGKTIIGQAGSPEGFGIQMQRINGIRAILFNDELGKLVSKAGIDGSGFSSDLLSWYGGEDFGNTVKKTADNFTFHAGEYTFGWLWCTTDRNFNHYWPKLAGIASGIEDRMFFVVSPEKPRESNLYRDPTMTGAKKTRELIDRAINQRTFPLEDAEMFETRIKGMDPRSQNLVLKLALFFAIDLNLSVVDDDCAERACALVAYRNQAAAFLEPIEADNAEGRLQKEMLRELRQHLGRMPYREFCRNLEYHRYGTRNWNGAYRGLVSQGDLVEFDERRTTGKRATRMVGLVLHEDE